MKVYMLKDVEKVGMMGQVITVSDGYAANFLIPRKLAVVVTGENMVHFQEKIKKEQATAQVLSNKVSMLAERIKALHITIKERVHDDGKLYGSVGADEVVELLKGHDISINRKQVEFDKAVRMLGDHKVTIKLSSKLKPQFTLKVISQ